MGNELGHNPDILSCLANLSSDEVFTPPEIVNDILDLFPKSLWSNPNLRVLDPASKSGIFLREIAKRLIVGLETVIPNLQERVDHIFHKQLYGIAITELTGYLSRRSVYCSKNAQGEYSVTSFKTKSGNIIFNNIQHTWEQSSKIDPKCIYCGASKSSYGRSKEKESYAYEFIHLTDKKIKEYKDMHFDLIISNPPYQLSDGGGGGSAMPIYQKFVEQAKKLNPRYMTMITPSRWFAGGRGLDDFRREMLADNRIRVICDYPNASDCFPGVEIKGGVNYFLWDRDNPGDCKVITHSGNSSDEQVRPLLEDSCDTFIRYNKAISILRKVRAFNEPSFSSLVSANDPFGYDVRVENSYLRVKPDIKTKAFPDAVKIYYFGWQSKGIGYIDKSSVRKNNEYIDKCKIFISRAYGAGEVFPHQILGMPFIADTHSVCTETYLMIGPVDNIDIAQNIISYIQTKFFRFMVMLKKNTQSATPTVYQFVPMLDFSKAWSDEELFKKYGFESNEIEFIESMIRPMDVKE